MTIREISDTLAEIGSLMQGKLAWDSWSEFVTFKTPGGTIQAQPILLAAPTPERIACLISDKDKNRLLIVPYLSDSLLDKLDQEKTIMAADLSGNGLIKAPPLYIRLSGKPNLFPDSRPAVRPYEKNSAQAAMVLLEEKKWKSQTEILDRIKKRGGSMTKGQLSKLIARYESDGALRREKTSDIIVSRPERLLEGLFKAWRPPQRDAEKHYRFHQATDWEKILNEASKRGIKWCMTPQYSLQKYAFSGEGAPMSLWTDSPKFFQNQPGVAPSPSPSFAHLTIIATRLPTAFFQTACAENIIWSGPVATWIAFANGDARQQEMARPLYKKLIEFQCKQLINSIEK